MPALITRVSGVLRSSSFADRFVPLWRREVDSMLQTCC